MKLVVSMLLSVAFSQVALGAKYKISLEHKVQQGVSTYQQVDRRSAIYEMVSHRQVIDTKITGEGPFSALNQTNRGQVSNEVLGVTVNGHAKLELVKNGNGVTVKVDRLINDTLEGVRLRVPIRYSVPATFTRGNWESFQAGREVEIQFTTEAEQNSARAHAAPLRESMKKVREQIRREMGSTVGEIKIESIRVRGRTKIKASLTHVEITASQKTTLISFDNSL